VQPQGHAGGQVAPPRMRIEAGRTLL
jgi:hypothetical protein